MPTFTKKNQLTKATNREQVNWFKIYISAEYRRRTAMEFINDTVVSSTTFFFTLIFRQTHLIYLIRAARTIGNSKFNAIYHLTRKTLVTFPLFLYMLANRNLAFIVYIGKIMLSTTSATLSFMELTSLSLSST